MDLVKSLQEGQPLDSFTHEEERALRPGDVVEVKSAAEILATLDREGAADRMPFMPEMLRHVGRRYTVTRRVDKICDTIAATGSRRMHAMVYLNDLRCDGSGHGGCQAGCKLYWKEAWLRRVDSAAPATDPADEGMTELERLLEAGTRPKREVDDDGRELWRCQATDALEASEPLRTSNLGQYWRELRNGNFGLLRFIHLASRGFVMEVARPPRPSEAAPVARPAQRVPAGGAPGNPGRRKCPGAPSSRDRGHSRRERLQPRPLLRPRDASLLRADLARQGQGRSAH